jgi:hypothetical protein
MTIFSAPPHSLDGRLYRAALALCPVAFRQDHGDEMARDFDEARREAAADGRGALWHLRSLIAIDLVRTLAVQWTRTGIPIIAIAAVSLALGMAAGLATLARRASVQIPPALEHEEELIVVFMATICVALIATTIVLSLWVGRLTRPRRR